MFIELTIDAYDKFVPYLQENGYKYSVSDATLPNDSIKHMGIQFDYLSKQDAEKLGKVLDSIYNGIAVESNIDKTIEEDILL